LIDKLNTRYNRILDKIKAVQKSKDISIIELEKQLNEYQNTNHMMQSDLEYYRDQKIGLIN
jgi:hypothetical protein